MGNRWATDWEGARAGLYGSVFVSLIPRPVLQKNLIKIKDGKIEICSKTYPDKIWQEEPCGWFGNFCKGDDRDKDRDPEQNDINQGES